MDKDVFNNCLSKLVNEDFSFDPDLGSWERMKKIRIERINIGYNEYPGSYYPKGMGAYIKFNDVEDILNKVLDKYKIQQRYGNETIRSVLFNLEGVDYGKFKTEIHDNESFQIVAEEIKKIVKYGAMPFFDRYQTLEEVHNYANQLSLEEYSRFFSGYGSLKMMIIKKLLKIDDYESYSHKMIQNWISIAKEYPQHFENLDKVVVDLKNVLDKM
ncbi:MAG: hypothetical protein LBL58_14590 [Tannerellaceae bacterium]|jgi:tRNA isopentenyl-2-thiomethyl-A-37 hydroxylase MiaE|nr:hypothetical protein [Tannerellaceae bacterium]